MEQKYKLARLVDCAGDLEKEWYIVFYVWNADTNTLQRKRDYSLNIFKTKKDRKNKAAQLIEEINKRLISNTYSTKIASTIPKPVDFDSITFFDAMEKAFELKKSILRPTSKKGYVTTLLHLKNHLTQSGNLNIRFKTIGAKETHEFFDYLRKTGMGNRAYNNRKGDLSALFNLYIKREEITKNPVNSVDKLKVETGKHNPYTADQMTEIKEYLTRTNKIQFLNNISFIYYCFIRTEELRNLRVRDIYEKTIRVVSGSAKNGRGEHIVIPHALERLILENNYRSYPPDSFLFTLSGLPGDVRVGGKYFYRQNAKMLEALNMKGLKHDHYAYKHTGVIALYKACKDIIAVQRQCRHSTVQQTLTYLRELGQITNNEVINFPEF